MEQYQVRKEMRLCLEKKECNEENIKNYIRFMREEYSQNGHDIRRAGEWNNDITLGMVRVIGFWVLIAIGLFWLNVKLTEVIAVCMVVGFMATTVLATWPNKMKRSATKYLKAEDKKRELEYYKKAVEEECVRAEKYKEELEKKYCSE